MLRLGQSDGPRGPALTLRWQSLGFGLFRPADAAARTWALSRLGDQLEYDAGEIAAGVEDDREVAIWFLRRR